MQSRESLPSWQALISHAQIMTKEHMKEMFVDDNQRFKRFSIKLPLLLLDFSKNLITEQTLSKLVKLAQDCDIESWREKMFNGERINTTENRAVLHIALRDKSGNPLIVDGVDITVDIKLVLAQIRVFSEKVRQGQWFGYSGKAITDVVSIGVGGSNLGPQMVTEALKKYSDKRINVHYVSNVDGTQIAQVLRPLNPETVLFIVSSKTFTTSETMRNANTAMKWLVASSFDESSIKKHFIAISANKKNVTDFGISTSNIFNMWDWVGGRFSLWSAIGLPIALDIGFDNFTQLLEGASQIDEHFKNEQLSSNAPVILALLSIWNCTFLGAKSQAILPYDQSLHMLSAYLQQAEMESNGKSVNWHGKKINYATVPSIWGELGINGQHAFYQYLHQSNNIIPADFIGSIESNTPVKGHHETLMANFFAQSQALMQGVSEDEIRNSLQDKKLSSEYIDKVTPHKVHEGNRPTNTILLNRISPKSLGSLIALYEHKIFVQGIILQVCSFDQWGVELGKGLANIIEKDLLSKTENQAHDCSTAALIAYFKSMKEQNECSRAYIKE